MSLKGKKETEIEIKAPADKFYNFFKGQTYHVTKATPTNIQEICNIIVGNNLSLMIWFYEKYFFPFKELLEMIY
ncbi:hypothetical protein ACOSP7_009328 [Xanthoceras sorbifolium]